jgi:hypothetical protein
MARIRSVKPQLRTSLTVAEWPREVRYFWVLLWGYLDDEGRGVDDSRLINADCFPLDDDITRSTVDEWLTMMMQPTDSDELTGPVCRYRSGGRRYLHAPDWKDHQKPQHPRESEIPPCPWHDLGEPYGDAHEASPRNGVSPHEDVVKASRAARENPGTAGGQGTVDTTENGSSVQATAIHDDLTNDSGGPHEPLTPEGEREKEGNRRRRGNARTRSAASGDDPPSWDEFWSTYPRKEARGAAKAAYARALARKGVTVDKILAGARVFADACRGMEAEYIPHPTTWLNQERWGDEPVKRRPDKPANGGRRVSSAESLSGWEDGHAAAA